MLDYGSILAQYAQAIQATEQNYANLYSDVVGGVQGMEQSALTKAQEAYQSAQGNITAGLVRSGLGNSTIQSNQQQQALRAYGETVGGIENQFAGTIAQTKLQAGLAGLGYRGQAAQAYASLGGQFAGQEAQTALGYAGLANQRAIAGMRGGGGGGVILPNYGGGGGGGGYGGARYAGDPGLTYASGGGGGSMSMGSSYGTSAPAYNPYAAASPYLDLSSSGGDFGSAYGSYGEY